MKKTLPFLIIILIPFSQVMSQHNLGIKAGLNYVNNVVVPNDNSSLIKDNEYRIAYHLGFYSKFNFNKKIYLNTELMFSNKGCKFKKDNSSSGGNLHLNYLNVPILFGVKMIDKLAILAGPEVGYLISAKSKVDSQTIDVSEIWDNKIDFALAGGANYFLSESIGLDIRYTHGLSSVIKDAQIRDEFNNPIGNNLKLQNRAIQISITYKLK
jgi:opacity protein-like surface antigen